MTGRFRSRRTISSSSLRLAAPAPIAVASISLKLEAQLAVLLSLVTPKACHSCAGHVRDVQGTKEMCLTGSALCRTGWGGPKGEDEPAEIKATRSGMATAATVR